MKETANIPIPPADTKAGANSIAKALVESGVLFLVPDSPITFASGLVSPVYMDVRQLLAKPDCWRQVVSALSQAVKPFEPQLVAGVAVGGIPHSTAVAIELGLPSCFIRLAQKSHGRGKNIEGAGVGGKRVVLVEDVITTGGSSLEAAQILREHGAEVMGCIAIASYGFETATDAFEKASVDLAVLVPFKEMLATAEMAATKTISEFPKSALEEARQWHADPQRWQNSLSRSD